MGRKVVFNSAIQKMCILFVLISSVLTCLPNTSCELQRHDGKWHYYGPIKTGAKNPFSIIASWSALFQWPGRQLELERVVGAIQRASLKMEVWPWFWTQRTICLLLFASYSAILNNSRRRWKRKDEKKHLYKKLEDHGPFFFTLELFNYVVVRIRLASLLLFHQSAKLAHVWSNGCKRSDEQIPHHQPLCLLSLSLCTSPGVFLICWLPFFVTHILNTHCRTCYVPPGLYSAFTWLGYVNSALNPVIYTTFNIEFRRAFIKILSCWGNCTMPWSLRWTTLDFT